MKNLFLSISGVILLILSGGCQTPERYSISESKEFVDVHFSDYAGRRDGKFFRIENPSDRLQRLSIKAEAIYCKEYNIRHPVLSQIAKGIDEFDGKIAFKFVQSSPFADYGGPTIAGPTVVIIYDLNKKRFISIYEISQHY